MSDRSDHNTRIIDRALATLYAKRVYDKNDRAVKIWEPTIIKLRMALRNTRIFLYTDEIWRAAEQLYDAGFDLIMELLPRLRMPLDSIWIEPLSESLGELPDDIARVAYLFQRAPDFSETAFCITPFNCDDKNAAWSLISTVFDPINEIFGKGGFHTIWEKASPLFNEKDMQNLAQLREHKESATARFTMHGEWVTSAYPVIRQLTIDKMPKLGDDEFMTHIREATADMRDAVCLLMMLNLGGKLAPEIGTDYAPRREGLPRNFKEFLSHRIVTINVAEERVSREIRRLMHGLGIRKKRHEVIEHWCVSRRLGNPNCRTVRRVCKPRIIDARSNACEFCEKTEWRREAHMRGDASLGFITHEYVVKE
jgi:hypothetical protein